MTTENQTENTTTEATASETPENQTTETEGQTTEETSTNEGGLFDNVDDSTPEAPEATAETTEEETTQEGDKPEFLLDKFSSVEEQAKAYIDLQKKLGERFNVPEQYDVSEEKLEKLGLEVTDKEQLDATLSELKELNASQEMVDWVLKKADEYGKQVMSEFGPSVDTQAEMEALKENWGDSTTERLKATRDWAVSNMPEKVVKQLSQTAEGVDYMYKQMLSGRGPNPVSNTESDSAYIPTKAEVYGMMDDDRYARRDAVGEAYRKEVEAAFRKYTSAKERGLVN